jgi:hypothetical protein
LVKSDKKNITYAIGKGRLVAGTITKTNIDIQPVWIIPPAASTKEVMFVLPPAEIHLLLVIYQIHIGIYPASGQIVIFN